MRTYDNSDSRNQLPQSERRLPLEAKGQEQRHVFPYRWRVAMGNVASLALLVAGVYFLVQVMRCGAMAEASTPNPSGLLEGTATLDDYPGLLALENVLGGLVTGTCAMAVCWNTIRDEPTADDGELARDFSLGRAIRNLASDAATECRTAASMALAVLKGCEAKEARHLVGGICCAIGMSGGAALLVLGLSIGWFNDPSHLWQFVMLPAIIGASMVGISRL